MSSLKLNSMKELFVRDTCEKVSEVKYPLFVAID